MHGYKNRLKLHVDKRNCIYLQWVHLRALRFKLEMVENTSMFSLADYLTRTPE